MKELMKGWVRVSDYDKRPNKSVGGPTGTYGKILAAIHQEPSPIRAYRDGKFWIAVESDVEAFVASLDEAVQKEPTPDAYKKFSDDPDYGDLREGVLAVSAFVRRYLLVDSPGNFDCVNAATASIERIEKVLERLALAVESIATQPAGSWRDMNGEVMN